jgi:hypothetical protein
VKIVNRSVLFGIAFLTATALVQKPLWASSPYAAQAAATKAYALKALAFYKAHGLAATKASFLTPKLWFLGPDQWSLHVAGLTSNEIVWADSAFPDTIGQSYQDVEDLDGVPLGATVWNGLAKSPSGAAVQLRYNNPSTGAVAHTEGYCIQADSANVICAWSQSN